VGPWRHVERVVAGGLLAPAERVVVAVSGGADSVFLLLALHGATSGSGPSLHVAHLDHRWRGDAGAADAAWVAELSRRLGLPHTVGRADAPAHARAGRLSPEEAARDVRYAFLRDVCRETGATTVAIGHTLDDQVETVLLALLRGGGPGALGGMRPSAPFPAPESAGLRLARPLLGLQRESLRAALRARGQAWRDDPSNLDPRLPRNRLRRDVLPLLEQIAPGYRRAVARSAALVAGAADLLRQEAQRAAGVLFRSHGGALRASRRELLALHPAVRAEALRWAVRQAAPSPRLPEWAPLQGALEMVERGRGGAVAWLAPGVRLRLERGQVVVEPDGGPDPDPRPHT
jgi:tRNA(Ile)-lysidine synthase